MKRLFLTLVLFAVSFVTFGQTKVVIESNDQMRFNKSEIVVQSGERVTLTLKHTGSLPVQAMGHNWVLLKKGTDVPTFARKAMNARNTGFVPPNSSEVIVYTKTIGGGQETTITFTAPSKGTYDFICSFPGHFSMMKGKFIVR